MKIQYGIIKSLCECVCTKFNISLFPSGLVYEDFSFLFSSLTCGHGRFLCTEDLPRSRVHNKCASISMLLTIRSVEHVFSARDTLASEQLLRCLASYAPILLLIKYLVYCSLSLFRSFALSLSLSMSQWKRHVELFAFRSLIPSLFPSLESDRHVSAYPNGPH
jgi:hypothetical protein